MNGALEAGMKKANGDSVGLGVVANHGLVARAVAVVQASAWRAIEVIV